jgi:hypothetical protein
VDEDEKVFKHALPIVERDSIVDVCVTHTQAKAVGAVLRLIQLQ